MLFIHSKAMIFVAGSLIFAAPVACGVSCLDCVCILFSLEIIKLKRAHAFAYYVYVFVCLCFGTI